MAREWTAKVKSDGSAVKVYRWGKEDSVVKASADTFKPATAMKFAEKLCQELAEQSSADKTADHDVQDEPNLKTDAKGTAVTGKPSPTMSTQQDKVSKLVTENKKLRAKMAHMEEKHQLEIKARRGAKLAEFLISQGSLEEDEKIVTAFVGDVAQMTDDEIDRLERKAAGKSEFESAEEAERAEANYRRAARILRRQADDAHLSGDVKLAEEIECQALDADKNADCCRSFVRAAAHPKVAKCSDCGCDPCTCDGECNKCGASPCACSASDKTADSAVQDAAKESKGKDSEEKDAAADTSDADATDDADDTDDKTASDDGEADEAASDDDDGDKTADHDVQDAEQLDGDSKGVAVTGKPSPNLNDGKKKASDEEDTEDTMRDQHLRMATYYRKKADAAEGRGDLVSADTFDHKADICEDLAKDSSTETINPEPELAGVTGAKEAAKPMCDGCGKPNFACECDKDGGDKDVSVDDSADKDASVEDDGSNTHGPETGSAKTATEEENADIDIPMEMIEAAVTPPEVAAMRSASRGQRRNEPSRASVEASGVTRIASVEENSMSNDSAVCELESLWSNPSRDEE